MTTRREFIKKTAYAAPAIATLSAKPAFAGSGSNWRARDNNGNNSDRNNENNRNRKKNNNSRRQTPPLPRG